MKLNLFLFNILYDIDSGIGSELSIFPGFQIKMSKIQISQILLKLVHGIKHFYFENLIFFKKKSNIFGTNGAVG